MRVVLERAGGEVDVEVAVHDPAATAADLAAALSGGDGTCPALVVDGCLVPGSVALAAAGLRPGCAIALDGPATAAGALVPAADPGTELLVVGGLAAGARHALAPGCWMVGRDPSCAVVLPSRTTSSRHAAIFVDGDGGATLADAGSTAGTWVDGRRLARSEPLAPDRIAAVGACLVRVAPLRWCEPAVLGRPGGDGRRPLHRPPSPAVPAAPAPLRLPAGGEAVPADAPRFGWAAALVPLVGGLVLARLVDPRLALFTLLGPAVLIGQWLEDKRRHRRRRADAGATRRAGLEVLATDIADALAAEGRRRHALHPDPAVLANEIDSLSSALWSRRPDHPCFAVVAVGSAPALAWMPATTKAVEGPEASLLSACRLPPGCPAAVELSPASHVGLAGPRSAALAVARWMIVQLAANHGPADLRIAVTCRPERAADWDWVAFLPHVTPPHAGGRRLLATGAAEVRQLGEMHAARGDGELLVVVVDGDDLVDGSGSGLGSFGAAVTTITIAPSRRALPGRCTCLLELDGPDGWGRLTAADGPPQAVLGTGIEHASAKRWARRLAQLTDPEEASRGAPPPAKARLLDLLGIDDPTADEVLRRWAQRRGPVVPVGCTGGAGGVRTVQLDLVSDGPHALVAGTTGAGKSELLRSLVAGLAASVPPDRLVMLLVDYKGGAAFAEAARLPHVLGVVTDLGPDEAARAIHSLEAELRRREAVLAELGLRDLADHPGHGPTPPTDASAPLPRLVVVVDELAALVAELPSFLDDLVQLAARGRSLGLHLVLATQRPGSVVSAAVRTNCAIRCCLRVPEENDALDVVGSPAPARLDRHQPGRAFLRRGAGDLLEVQVALAGGRRPPRRHPVSVRRAPFGPGAVDTEPVTGDGVSDLAALVGACRDAAIRAGHGPPRPVWLPPLPSALSAGLLPPSPDGVVVGLADDPGHQRRLPLTWHPAAGPLVALGGGPGPAMALQAVARLLAAHLDPGRLHVYGLDLGAQGLASLGELPHVAGLVRAGEHERLHRLVDRLACDLAARQEAAAGGQRGLHGEDPDDDAAPLVLLLVDGAGGLRSALDGARGLAAIDLLERVVVDGAALGMVVALAGDRLAAVPAAWAAAASLRLAFRGGDPLDLLAVGAARLDRSAWSDGRCLDLGSGLLAQVATGGWPAPSGWRDPRRGGPVPIGTLPRHVDLAPVLADCPSRADDQGLCLVLGIDGRSLGPATVTLRPGQPFLVCGGAGSGRSTTLAALAASAVAAGCDVIDGGAGSDDLAGLLARHDGRGPEEPPLVVVVDDADRVPDPDGSRSRLAKGLHPGVHLVASAPPEGVRSALGHWSSDLRRAVAGLVLRPRSDLDADVLGVPLLPRWPVPLAAPGRGVLVVDGDAAPVQVAVP